MRVISGSAKGRKLHSPKGRHTRPTTDRVKEAMFNILMDRTEGSRCLDLFAGSGALGIEALSRQAQKAVFVDNDDSAVKLIKHNLQLAGFCEKGRVYKNDAFKILDVLSDGAENFDLIFLDPPYLQELVLHSVEKISSVGILAERGLIVAETDKKESLPDDIAGLKKVRSEKYGDTRLSFFQKIL